MSMLDDIERLTRALEPPWAKYRGCPRRLSEFAPEGQFFVLVPLEPVSLGGPPIVEKHTLVCHPKTFQDAWDIYKAEVGPMVSDDEMTAICIHFGMTRPKPESAS